MSAVVARALAGAAFSRRGLAIYSVRQDFARDPEGTLARVRELGYEAVELRGTTPDKARSLRAVCDRVGLAVPSITLEATPDLPVQLESALAFGARYAVIPAAPIYFTQVDGRFAWRESVSSAEAAGFVKIAAGAAHLAARMDLRLCYHTHDVDFWTLDNGSSMLDMLLGAAPANILSVELDLAWLKASGADLPGSLFKLRDRIKLVHLKDHDPSLPIKPKGRNLPAPGRGTMDLAALLATVRGLGAEDCFVELEHPATAWEDAASSLVWMRDNGF